MTTNTPSGQQAVELLPCPFCGGSALVIRCPPERDGQETLHRPQCDSCGADCGGCNTPSEAIALWNRRTAAPTPPSTAAGERIEVIAEVLWHRFAPSHHMTWEEEPEKAIYRDAALSAFAALATPPAQVGESYPDGVTERNHIAHDMRVGRFPKRSSIAEFLAERAPPAPSVPWAEQAARQCEEWADKLVERASAAPSVAAKEENGR